MKSSLVLILLIATISIADAQLKLHEGDAIWLPANVAKEKFRYVASDSTKTPVGEYLWKLNSENNESGWFELAQIKTNFRNKVADGEFEFLHYTLNFSIDDFDQQGIKSFIIGYKTIVRGRYNRGIPSGQWSFIYAPYNAADEKSLPVLTHNVALNRWSYQSDSISIIGQVDEKGFFNGRWEFKLPNEEIQVQEYKKGILTAIISAGKLRHENLWPNILNYIKETETSIPPDHDNPFIWQAGFSACDPIYVEQVKPASALNYALAPHKIAQTYIDSHPLLNLPEIAGTQSLKFSLSIADAESLRLNTKRLKSYDSLLQEKMELPVFQIRKLSNPRIDSLLKTTEDLIANIIRQNKIINNFLKEESRYKSPDYLLPEYGLNFRSHAEIAIYLNEQVNTLSTRVDRHSSDLLDAIEYLRIKGAVEDMESQWYYIKEEINSLIPNDNQQTFPLKIHKRFVENDYNERIANYALLNSYDERRQFLIDAITYYEYFNQFFKFKEYLKLTEVREEFIAHYTRFLYNPYMGVNNVEVVVKKKFIYHVLNNFWPFLLNKMEEAKDGQEFIALFKEASQYKQALTYLADDHSAEAKRLERRSRKGVNMYDFEILIADYTTYWQGKYND
jgi:hypothetical protein